MALAKAREPLSVQALFGGIYHSDSVMLNRSKVKLNHGYIALDQLIRELKLASIFKVQTRLALLGRASGG